MADMLTVTVGTTDYTFDWIAQEIKIETGVTDVTAADLKQAIKDAEDDVVGVPFPPIATFFNPVTLTATTSTFLNVVLNDQWRIDSLSASGTLTVGGGNVVNENNGIDIFVTNVLVNVINNTSAAGVLVVSGSGVTQQDKDDIEDQIFARVVEGAFTFEQMVRIIAASSAGDITQAIDGSYTVTGLDAVTARIVGELIANNGRDITATDGT